MKAKDKLPKKYVITVSRNFPNEHERKGEETKFIESIESKIKIHTIRGSFELWKKRFHEIEKGNAYISLRYWSGTPYKSKQIEFKRLTKDDGIGIELLVFDEKLATPFPNIISKEKIYVPRISNVDELASNDGLSSKDFKEWFKGYDLTKPMTVIHFTKFRYFNKMDVIDSQHLKLSRCCNTLAVEPTCCCGHKESKCSFRKKGKCKP